MEKEKESEKVTKERELEDDYYMQNIVLLTAGAAVLMACLKRAIVVLLLEEWRAWVFLLLNLVLLAILFISTLSTSNDNNNQEFCSRNDNAGVTKTERNNKKVRRQQRSKCFSEQVTKRQEPKECLKISGMSSKGDGVEPDPCKEDDMEAPRLSNEELNERAEAFILMFRQHLVSDARKCGKHLFDRPEKVERVKFQTCPR